MQVSVQYIQKFGNADSKPLPVVEHLVLEAGDGVRTGAAHPAGTHGAGREGQPFLQRLSGTGPPEGAGIPRRTEDQDLLQAVGASPRQDPAALGVKALQNVFSVSWLSADDLLQRLRRDEENPPRRNKRRKYLSSGVLVIDELGFQTLDRSDAHLLFKVVSVRYERSSTIITSNKSIREWPEMLAGDEVLTTAILDRLLHHCHVVHIDSSSYRLWEMEQRTGPKQRKEE